MGRMDWKAARGRKQEARGDPAAAAGGRGWEEEAEVDRRGGVHVCSEGQLMDLLMDCQGEAKTPPQGDSSIPGPPRCGSLSSLSPAPTPQRQEPVALRGYHLWIGGEAPSRVPRRLV